MNHLYRFMGTCTIAFILSCFVFMPFAYALPLPNTQLTVSEVFKLGVEEMRQGNYQGAITQFTQAIQLQNNFANAYSNRCLAYLQIQFYQNAVTDCTQAIKISPNNSEAYLNRGLAYQRQGNYQAAIADNNQVISIQTEDFRAYYNRGVANAYLGNSLQAIEDYNTALSYTHQVSNTLIADIYNERGLAYLQLTDQQTAILNFNRAINIDSSNYRIYFNRGCAHAQIRDYWHAIDDFSQVVTLNPQEGDAYLNRGIAYHNLGYEQAAIADLHHASVHFEQQGQQIAYKKTLNILKVVKQQIPDTVAIAMAW
ncbi:MAG: tetratricopeptide repeat protein [Richelia sp.]|nr:tetratricopeptide repeat protein [Richelia sp.]